MHQERKRGRSSYAHPRRRPRLPGQRTAQEEIRRTDESRGSVWINTISAGISAFITIPALILALLAYVDTKQQEEEGDIKEAAQISWFVVSSPGPADRLQIELENRSLRPIYDPIIVLPMVTQFIRFAETVAPCTRITYIIPEKLAELPKHEHLGTVGFLFFRDSLNHWWETGYSGGLSKETGPPYDPNDLISPVDTHREELQNCG